MIQHTNFYPRSPCGERRPASHLSKFNTSYFYPRSPCGERQFVHRHNIIPPLFLSTLSLRRATALRHIHGVKTHISIHALLAESDGIFPAGSGYYSNFYPRSPCGERRAGRRRPSQVWHISIHALLAESDYRAPPYNLMIHHFYPRSPCGERPSLFCVGFSSDAISIHALLAESDVVGVA